MRLLLFSDVHCDLEACRRLVKLAGSADLVIGAGDFASHREGLEEVIGVLRTITAPTVVVPGNAESDAELRDACEDWPAARVLHGSGCRLAGVSCFGFGGAVPPLGADWSFDATESQARGALAACPEGVDLLVTHSPPVQCADRTSSGDHIGAESVRETIERARPRLVVCGHVHDSWGTDTRLGESRVINAGPEGVWVEFGPAAPS